MSLEEIERAIPHRPPFLWLDEIVSATETTLHARKTLPVDLDVFTGHFPGRPIFPGVLQCEAAFQAAAVLMGKSAGGELAGMPVVTRVNNVKFRRMVRPGETLDIEVELTETLANASFFTGKVSVAGQVTVRLEFACALVADAT